MVRHLLNRTLEVWRPETTPDGSGGQQVALVQLDDVPAKVDQPSTEERQVAAQWGSDHSHNVYMPPGVDVARGDELRGDGQTFDVLAVVQPSRIAYTKARCELTQREGV